MPSYVAFLRAINLGAKRKFPKEAIRAAVESTGATAVETHINTGNVRLTTRMRSTSRVESALESAFLADRGFEVPTIAFRAAELAQIAADAEQLTSPDLARHYVLLLREDPPADAVEQIHAMGRDGHRAVVRNRACHLLLAEGYDEGQTDPLRVEKHLGLCTNRNLNVIRTLAQKWC